MIFIYFDIYIREFYESVQRQVLLYTIVQRIVKILNTFWLLYRDINENFQLTLELSINENAYILIISFLNGI